MIYEFDMKEESPVLKNHLQMGGDNGTEKIEVTNKYILKNDKPWIPFMGEYHYSRSNESEWKTELCKMKAGGVNVVAFYVIWIHHEEIEGEISFEGNLNIRKFVETCYECGLNVALRIGPWIHGEVKNGGFPDWLIQKPNIELRSNDPEYLKYCRKWYSAVANQLKGLMFKDGKPLLAIQIENELITKPEHMDTLLTMAKEVGFHAPIYTATGWGMYHDAQLPQGKFIPMYGGYPEAPWEQHCEKLEPSNHYFFTPTRNDSNIGKDLLGSTAGDVSKGGLDYDLFPYATCEIGGGVQVTHHRRPLICGNDIAAITEVKMGSGANLLGYYMYHGGRNPIGKTTTMNETKKSGYANDLPIIDYDFQAQLGAWGAVRDQYRKCKILALFLEDFGDEFAACAPYYQKNRINSIYDNRSLRYSVRLNGNRGYIFINNYARKEVLADHNNVQFKINGDVLPINGLNIKNEEYGFIPYNMKLNNILLKYSTAQPICRQNNTFFFFAPFDGNDELCFEKSEVGEIKVDGEIDAVDESIIVKNIKSTVEITGYDGEITYIEILSKEEAKHLYRHNGELYLCEADMVCIDNTTYVYGTDTELLNCKIYTKQGFVDCEVEPVKADSTQIEINEISGFENEFLEGFEYGDNTERKYYEIVLPNNRTNLILAMDITGDIAQLYADDILIADTFLYGRTWYVGPDKALDCEKLILAVNRLTQENKYLETEKKNGLDINKIEAKRLYFAKIMRGKETCHEMKY